MNFVNEFSDFGAASSTAVNNDRNSKAASWSPMQKSHALDSFFEVESATMTLSGAYLAPVFPENK